jgi:hypothetical protein
MVFEADFGIILGGERRGDSREEHAGKSGGASEISESCHWTPVG